MVTKTREEIEVLKHDWRKDPCWDIEVTEGFEEYAEELLAYRRQIEAEAECKVAERKAQRANKMKQEAGITDPFAAQCLQTFEEIEIDLHLDAQIGEASTNGELAALEIARANVRAILLLAAQVKRVADMYERHLDNLDADAERQEIRNLYRS